MRALLLLFLAAALAVPSGAGSTDRRVTAGQGLSAVLPSGWRLSRAPVTRCDAPEQVLLAAKGHVRPRMRLSVPPRAALVLLMETWDSGFPRRPAHFRLPRLGNLGGCCEMPMGRGAELLFRDHGRAFYAFVYVGLRAPAGTQGQVLRLLDSLRVSARR